MTLHLYELSPAIKTLADLMESETNVGTDWSAALEELQEGFDAKVVGLAKLIKTWEAEQLAYKGEIHRLQGHAQAAANKVAWAKEYLRANMEAAGLDHVKGDVVDIKLQGSKASVVITDEDAIPESFKTYAVTGLTWDQVPKKLWDLAVMSVQRVPLGETLKDQEVPGAELKPGKHIVIR